ncbi:hypothetical protein IE53DRAFT_385271 [Violaceomyces palustris]|uniref:Uncharacterized protein n=1 Tax=Violaceomyces palustris TaxID=1673888 RepID=A0ACD0P2S0_9BASI|nr:hypothetical protein IE53DRAFT_385271 [Violaceomyces palustris]
MKLVISLFFTLWATLFSTASALTIPDKRSSEIHVTVWNSCEEAFAPIFEPALPGNQTWPTIQPRQSKTLSFRSDTYKGSFYAPIQGSDQDGIGATHGEIDLEHAYYNINLSKGFNVGLYLSQLGKQYMNYCKPAICKDEDCEDAYRTESGLMQGQRKGESSTTIPNHSCSPSFSDWDIQFC